MPLPRRVEDRYGRLCHWSISCGDEVEVIAATEVEKAHWRAAMNQLGHQRKGKNV